MQNLHILPRTAKPAGQLLYNLDVIIAVGYRVNAKRGTQFRIRATQVLKDHLVRGYTLNQRRLAVKGIEELKQALALVANTLGNRELICAEVCSYFWAKLLQEPDALAHVDYDSGPDEDE